MFLNRVSLKRLWPHNVWPWLCIVVMLTVGPVLVSCGSAGPVATPTPTKTPRVEAPPTAAGVAAAATATPTEATAEPTATVAATETPAEEPTAGPSPTPIPPTPTTRPPAATPVVGRGDLMASPDYAVQTFLWWRPEEVADRDLGLVKDAGFRWVKQLFSWQDIEGAGKGIYDWTESGSGGRSGREVWLEADRAREPGSGPALLGRRRAAERRRLR
jgi:hypothetical protein